MPLEPARLCDRHLMVYPNDSMVLAFQLSLGTHTSHSLPQLGEVELFQYTAEWSNFDYHVWRLHHPVLRAIMHTTWHARYRKVIIGDLHSLLVSGDTAEIFQVVRAYDRDKHPIRQIRRRRCQRRFCSSQGYLETNSTRSWASVDEYSVILSGRAMMW